MSASRSSRSSPARLAAYTAAVREEIEESVRRGAGRARDPCGRRAGSAPARLRFLEIYADEAAYAAHVASPHFQRYAAATEGMIRSKRLLDAVEVALCAKR